MVADLASSLSFALGNVSHSCLKCGEFIYKGKKFNSRKETVQGEVYLGIKIFRFYIKCTRCAAEITFKTDPANSDYTVEYGASRNYEPWKQEAEEKSEADELQRKAEEDAFAKLEAKTMDYKEEMETLDALDELRSQNARIQEIDLEKLLHKEEEEQEQKDNAIINAIQFGFSPESVVRKIEDDATDPDLKPLLDIAKLRPKKIPMKKPKKQIGAIMVNAVKKEHATTVPTTIEEKKPEPEPTAISTAVTGLLSGYNFVAGSDSDSD